MPRPRRLRQHRAGTAFARLVGIMATLRSPRGCPWDRKQTHESLRSYLVEETYEALDAIDRGDLDGLKGELGDVLFQAVFHAELAAGAGRFDIADVVEAVTDKLVRRHPHVFTAAGRPLPKRAARSARTPQAVIEQWERIKIEERQRELQERQKERAGDGAPDHADARLLGGVPRALPALTRAHKIGARAASVGFDWPDATGVVDKIEEEARELRAALAEGRAQTVEEMGDLLFSLAQLARRLEIDPEQALREANDKFTRRFDAVEAHFGALGRSVHEATLEELEAAWTSVKQAAARARAATSGPSSRARKPRGRRSRR